MKKLVIAVDIDGVVADLVGRVCALLNEKAALEGRDVVRTPEDFRVYNLFATLTPDEQRAVNIWSASMGMCTSIKWYAGASLFLRTLKESGEVFAVTAPWKAPTWASERVEWLSPEIDKAHVISCSPEAKPFVCASADVLIEDRADTLAAWSHTAKASAFGILIDRPWNRDEEIQRTGFRKIVRVASLGEAARFVMHLATRGAA